MSNQQPMNERQLSGQRGGKKTAERYGSDYMASLGKQGGAYRDPTIDELRLMAEIKNNHKGGKITDSKNTYCVATITRPDGVILQKSKSGKMVKEIGAVS